MKKCARLTALGVVPDAMSAAQLVRVVLPRRRGGFARMKSGVGLQRRCWTRRSFEPILNLRVPESDGPCAWPAADFGSLRVSLKAGAGRPLFTGGSGSSSTARSGPLHFLWTHVFACILNPSECTGRGQTLGPAKRANENS